jgi:Domain of unknown function (DUF4430)
VAPKLNERVQALLFAAILMAAIAGLYATAQSLQPRAVATYAVFLPRLEIQGKGWSVDYRAWYTANNTVFLLLLEGASAVGFSVQYQTYQFPAGAFITAINGTVNGQGGYWQYWVNGTYGDVGADHRALHDYDVVSWNFTASQEGG